MSASVMELSILKLASPRRRSIHSARFTFDNDLAVSSGTSNNNSPLGSTSPPSPLLGGSTRMVLNEDMFTIFEQHRAAIPFKWEETPGNPRDDVAPAGAGAGAGGESLKNVVSGSEQEGTSPSSSSSVISRSSSSGTSCSEGEEEEEEEATQYPSVFQIEAICSSNTTITKENNSNTVITEKNSGSVVSNSEKQADELVSKGKTLPLKPPPGMNSIKQLLTLESEDRSGNSLSFRSATSLMSSSSIINSPRTHSRRSFRRDGLKALPFLSASSPRKERNEESLSSIMLGFEDWPKVVQQQNKQEKRQQDETECNAEHHRRATSMSRLSFSFRKKAATEKESSRNLLDADAIFNEDFGKKGGLRERKPLSSMSSRGLGDGYSNLKSKSWVFDIDNDHSDCETDTRSEYFGTSHIIAEGDEKDEPQKGAEAPKEKRKKHGLSRFSSYFRSSSSSSSGDQQQHQHRPKPSRLSSVSPATPPPLARTQSELKLKKASHAKAPSTNPLLKMCFSNPIGALLKNVRQLGRIEFSTPRAVMAK